MSLCLYTRAYPIFVALTKGFKILHLHTTTLSDKYRVCERTQKTQFESTLKEILKTGTSPGQRLNNAPTGQFNQGAMYAGQCYLRQNCRCQPCLSKTKQEVQFRNIRLTVRVDPPPPYGQLFVIFFGVALTFYYDYMCSEMDLTPEKSFSSNYQNSQLLLTATTLSQNGQIAVQQRRSRH